MQEKEVKKVVCIMCKQEFVPDRFHPRQKVCANPECQHQRQLHNQKQWRKNNPNYFKYKDRKTPWERKRAEYLRLWKQTHKNYFRIYRLKRQLKDKASRISLSLSPKSPPNQGN